MNERVKNIAQEPESNSARQVYRVEGYLAQLNSLLIIRHLNLLLIAAQKHRGATLASLDGGIDFAAKVPVLQQQIASYLSILERLNIQGGELISPADLAEIHREWEGLVCHLDESPVIASFELHSHFMDKLIKLIWRLAMRCQLFARKASSEHWQETDDYNERDHRALVQITMKLLPELIETIAKIRGLATHAAVCGVCDKPHQVRFSYLFQQLNSQNEALRKFSMSLKRDTLTGMPVLSQILLNDHKLGQLQHMVTHQIVVIDKIDLQGHVVFDFATDIIDIYHRVINDGVGRMQSYIEKRIN